MTEPGTREVEQRMAHLKEVCRTKGLRMTPQRMEIFRELAQTGDHPDADQVFKRVRQRLPNVSLDTVYRTLWMLNEHGLITTLGPGRERTRFDANLERHHHFVCTSCGLTRDFTSEELDELALPSAARAFGRIETTLVEVRGICRECAARKDPVRGP